MELTWTPTLRKEFGCLSGQRILWLLRLKTHCGKAEKLLVAQSRISKHKRINIQIMCCLHYFVWVFLKIHTLSHSHTQICSITRHQLDFLRTNMCHKTIFICGTFTSIVSAEAQDCISMKIEVPLYSKWCSLILGQSWRKANTQEHALMVALWWTIDKHRLFVSDICYPAESKQKQNVIMVCHLCCHCKTPKYCTISSCLTVTQPSV